MPLLAPLSMKKTLQLSSICANLFMSIVIFEWAVTSLSVNTPVPHLHVDDTSSFYDAVWSEPLWFWQSA